jgi:septum formation protein|tara:strand:- start:8896 stop:9537 length:642 start_codon:yes stop_codon:yes gene_type:complete
MTSRSASLFIQTKKPLILASGSASRQVMLKDAGINFKVVTSDVDEAILKEKICALPFNEQVIALAAAKASVVSSQFPEAFVIGGDQMCIHEDTIFDKPGTQENAINNLKKLSGTSHFQYSGICIYQNNIPIWKYSEYAIMTMHELSDQEIINYVQAEDPIGAAGAYKFESLGCNLFKSVEGSSYTVRGMPLLPLLNQLRELDIINLEAIETLK